MPYANPSPASPSSGAPHTRSNGSTAVLIFAKAPIPGHCKRRLARTIGAVRATVLYRRLLEHAVARACASDIGPVTLVCAPDTHHAFFQRLSRHYRVELKRQIRGDLGRRMHRATRRALIQHDAVLLMGCDQPDIDVAMLGQAAEWLAAPNRAWLGPTCDGGYWLIGASRAEARLFQGMRWSTPTVARHTTTRLARTGLAYRQAPLCRDIDTALDVKRLPRALARTVRNADS